LILSINQIEKEIEFVGSLAFLCFIQLHFIQLISRKGARCPSFLFISQSIFPLGRED